MRNAGILGSVIVTCLDLGDHMMTDVNRNKLDERGKNFRINGDRLWGALMEMAKIGPGVAGGNNRQTLTDEDAEGRSLFKSWCEAEGMKMGLDKMGNMFARHEGSDPSLPQLWLVAISIPSQRGGKYDGVLGVLAGLEIIRTLNETGIKTKHSIEVVNWTNEEGTRFSPPMLASGVFAGVHSLDWAYSREDVMARRLVMS